MQNTQDSLKFTQTRVYLGWSAIKSNLPLLYKDHLHVQGQRRGRSCGLLGRGGFLCAPLSASQWDSPGGVSPVLSPLQHHQQAACGMRPGCDP